MRFDALPYAHADAPDPRRVLDLVLPDDAGRPGARPFDTVVWLHGGGLTGGAREIPPELAGPGVAVAGVEYRLAPDARYPDYLVDAAAATAWVLDHIADHGGDPARVHLAGHSAGAYLAAMVGMDPRWLAAHGRSPADLASLLLASGSSVTHFHVRAERGLPEWQVVADDDAPLRHVRRDLPPVFLVAGADGKEVAGRRAEVRLLDAMLRLAGHHAVRAWYDADADHGQTAALAGRLFRAWLTQGVWPDAPSA